MERQSSIFNTRRNGKRMNSKLVNYEQLEEMLKKHDVDNKISHTYTSLVFEKVFVAVTTVFIVLFGVLLFLTLLPMIILEAIVTGIYKGIKNAKEVSD